ncbi:hypothetical protein GCM10020254_02500 [Streptomyces goshikiensis]
MEAGVLDGDGVARPQFDRQQPRDAVQGAVGEGHVGGRHPVAGEPRAGELLQGRQPRVPAVRSAGREDLGGGVSTGRNAGSGWPPARSRMPAGTFGGRREPTAGVGATTVPPRPRVTTMPRPRSSLYAVATVPGLTPRSSASRRTGGRAAPGPSPPSVTARSTDAAISLADVP